MTENEIAAVVVDAAIEVHRTFGGSGLLESVYEEALVCELEGRGLHVERQREAQLSYKGKLLDSVFRVDFVIDGKIVVECKATIQDNAIYEAQALTYLRLLDLRLALVINFGHRLVKDGIHRVVNEL